MENSEALLNEWKAQAKKDGLLDDYEYHLGMVYPPLPYGRWRLKFNALKRIQDAPDYMDNMKTLRQETQLCNELGY